MSDIKSKTKQRILDVMVRSVKKENSWKVMIVDATTMRIISAACRMFDIMEEGITLVEKIDNPRDSIPTLDAIYFLSPTAESVDLLIKDFDGKQPKYANVFLFFSSRLPDDLLNKIKQAKVVHKIKALKEINMDYIAYEQNVFHLDSPDSFQAFFSPESTSNVKEQKKIAEKLVSICATLKEYPIVRYIANTPVAASLANIVQDKLDELYRNSTDYSSGVNTTSTRAVLLILDRSFDVITPLLHEFTYQAMSYDLLPIENDRYKYSTQTNDGSIKEKEVLISEQDPVWPTLRHMHIADTMNWILDNFNQFVKDNKASKLYSGKKVESLKEMSEAMKAMPQYKEMLDKYSLHINMANANMKIFEQNQLKRIAFVEQDMSTGEDAEGNPVKNVMSSLPPILTDETIDKLNKIRLLMLYIISQEGIKDGDRKRLMDLAKIGIEEQECVSNLRYLGVTLLKGAQVQKKKQSKEKKKKKERDDAPPYELSRYAPLVKKIGEDILDGSLSTSEFPAVKEDIPTTKDSKGDKGAVQSLRKTTAAPKWASDKDKRKQEKEQEKAGGRVIIFIAGGIVFSEMRSVYELSAKYNRDVILGSTAIFKPTEFVQALGKLKKDTVDDATEKKP